MNRSNFALLRPMILFFILLNAFFIVGRNTLAKWGIDQSVVIVGNLVLFVVNLTSFLLSRRAMNSANPNVFVRAMYAGFMIKFFVCVIVAFIYFTSFKKNINKPALFICMGLVYCLYCYRNIHLLPNYSRKKKNA